jgi:hypothetical protein
MMELSNSYSCATALKNNQNLGLTVKYKNDSISLLRGTPIPIIEQSEGVNSSIKSVKIAVVNIPKCSRNFYVIDSTDKVIDSCLACESINTHLDYSHSYSLKVEYIDSSFHIKHSVLETII